MNTIYKYKELLGDRTIAENRENCSFIWDNYYNEEEKLNEYDLSIFVKAEDEFSETEDEFSETGDEFSENDHRDGTEGELFIRYEETHYQRGYSLEEIRALLEAAGMRFVTAYEAFTKIRCPTRASACTSLPGNMARRDTAKANSADKQIQQIFERSFLCQIILYGQQQPIIRCVFLRQRQRSL